VERETGGNSLIRERMEGGGANWQQGLMGNADVIAGEGDKIDDTADYDSESIRDIFYIVYGFISCLVYYYFIVVCFTLSAAFLRSHQKTKNKRKRRKIKDHKADFFFPLIKEVGFPFSLYVLSFFTDIFFLFCMNSL
jgi:hypothetical protein